MHTTPHKARKAAWRAQDRKVDREMFTASALGVILALSALALGLSGFALISLF